MGTVLDEEYRSQFLQCQSEGWKPENVQGSINTTCHSQRQGWVYAKQELLQSGTAPHVVYLCLPDVTAYA